MKFHTLTAVAALMLGAAPAVAQTVLTVNIEPATTWVRNFNPFNQKSARQSTLDFIYEPLVIFNQFDSNKPVYRLAESFTLSETQESELLAAMAEIEHGEYVSLDELLQSLPKHS